MKKNVTIDVAAMMRSRTFTMACLQKIISPFYYLPFYLKALQKESRHHSIPISSIQRFPE